MTLELNHTIVTATDGEASARWFADVFGTPEPRNFPPFWEIRTGNGVNLDFMSDHAEIHGQHYAFLVTEDEFDEIFGRIQERGIRYWADPHAHQPQAINHHDGGRGVYFANPDGHWLEIITRPYGWTS